MKLLKYLKINIRKDYLFPYCLMLPATLLMILIIFYPLFTGIRLSFYNAPLSQIRKSIEWVGLKNYVSILSNPNFWQSFKITVYYTLVSSIGSFLIGLALASLMNSRFKGRKIARTLVMIPWAVPHVVTAMIWVWMLDYQYGVINYLGRTSGILENNVGWLTNPTSALLLVSMVQIWKLVPISGTMLLAGLQSIPEELYEAAAVDGVTKFSAFRYITLPALRPVSRVVLLLLFIWTFRRFALIYLMTRGGPARSTETLAIGIYREAFTYHRFGNAAVIGVFTLIIIFIMVIFYFRSVYYSEK